MLRLTQFALTAVSVTLLTASAFAQTHEDNRMGFKMRQPKEFTSIPIKATEEWIVAKFLSEKSHFFTDPDLKLTYEHKPEMQVIAFLGEKFKEDKVERETDEDDGVTRIKVRFTNPYKDYPDYLKGTYSGGGFFIDEEVEAKVGDYEVTQYLVRVEKGSNGPKRVIAWVYHTEDIDFAIQFECFESSWKKLKSDITRALKSFEEIERTEGTVVKAVATDDVIELTDTPWNEIPAKEREKIRKGREKRSHEQALVGLPESWEIIEEDGFLVLNHGGDKAADDIVEHGDAVFRWCEKNLGFIGSDEYVMRPVIRICKDRDEEFAFRQGSSDWLKPSLEIVTHKDTVGIGSWEYRWLNSRFLGHWLWQSDADLMAAMPGWMRYGLQYSVEYGKHKGKKFELRQSDWEMMGLRERVKSGLARTPREIFLSDSDGFAGSDNGRYEAAALMRYLLVGSGSKKRLTRNLLEDYYACLKEVAEELNERDDDSPGEATTEEEEDAQFKAAQQRWKKKEKEVAEMLFERVFAGWSDKDWAAFERDYFKAIS